MEKTKKRLIIFMPSMDGGGVEKNLIIVANFLSRHIKYLTLITFDNGFNRKFSKKIKIINYKKKTNKRYSKYFKYLICLLILSKEIIINKRTPVFSFQANIYCLILSKILNFKVIIRSNSAPQGWTENFVKKTIFKLFFKFAKKIIVNSKDFKKEIDKEYNIKSVVIYNPLNIREIKEKSKEKVNMDFFKSRDTLKIINIARFTDQKDHLTLLKAFNNVSKIIKAKLLIMGYGANEKIINNFILNNNLNKIVKIIPFKTNPYKYLKSSDLFVLTSTYEGLPNVLLEAMALKKYIISSDCPTGPREILQNGKLGMLFKVKNHKQLKEKIIDFNNNKKTYQKKLTVAFATLERFDFLKNCNKYLEIINKI